MAPTPETSDFTSIKERINPCFDLAKATQGQTDIKIEYFKKLTLKPLLEFEGNLRAEMQSGVLFSYADYLVLVDTTGRIQRDDKRGAIDSQFLPILQRLDIDESEWFDNAKNFEKVYQKRFSRPPRLKTAI